MFKRQYAAEVAELRRMFAQSCPREADATVVEHCFEEIIDVHTKNSFPDILYLCHTFEALRIMEGDTLLRKSLSFALWYQNIAEGINQQDAIERSVVIARNRMSTLLVDARMSEAATDLIWSTYSGMELRGSDEYTLADVNTYASYGISGARTNNVLVQKTKQNRYSREFVRHVLSRELTSRKSRQMYFHKAMNEECGILTQKNVDKVLKNLGFVGTKPRAQNRKP